MIRTLIIDDEPKNTRILKELLQVYCPQVFIAGEAGGFHQAIEMIKHEKPELLLLDIEMPYGNAFDLLDKVMPLTCEIIFITAFNEYALKAFKYSALDYLLKPVAIQDLQAAILKAEQRLQQKNINNQLANLLANFKKPTLQKIALHLNDGIIFVPEQEILYLQASGAYTIVHLQNLQNHTTSRNIKEYEDLLPPQNFCRVHHSFIININHIKKYNKGRGGVIEMEDGFIIEVSQRRRTEFLALFDRR